VTQLSLTAIGRLAEREVRQAGGVLAEHEVLARLRDHDVDPDRARAGLRLALTVGRVIEAEDAEDGTYVLALPAKTEEAA
jgi:hypothetical protein